MTHKIDDRELMVDCPSCGTRVIWNDSSLHRPFCSKRCMDSDFIGWANESNQLPGSAVYEDIFSEDTNTSSEC